MTAVQLLLLVVLAAASGFAVLGTVVSPLRIEERVAIAVVAAFVLDGIAGFLLSLPLGLGPPSILFAPVLVAGVSLGIARLLGVSPVTVWRNSWDGARGSVQIALGMAGLACLAALCFSLLFSRAMFQDAAGDLVTGYWIPDWAGHLITASSFSVAQNLPPQDPLMSGTPLYYPFLPDFSSAMLMRLGLAAGPSLWVPQAVLGITLVVLLVSFAARLGAPRSVGVIAVVICFLGGGLGFVGAFGDACTHGGNPASQCNAQYVITHPGDGVAITASTLRALPGLVADQPRSYDGMTTAPDAGTPVFADQEWYTPLFAWWLPQRTLVEGFDTVLAVLLLLAVALGAARVPGWDLAVAGVLAGMLPVIHVQSLFALGIICIGLALMRWRPDWLVFAGAAVLVALPRTIQLLGAPHGLLSPPAGTRGSSLAGCPMALGSTALPQTISVGNILAGAGDVLWVPFTGAFWSFWLVNLGIAVPLSLAVVLALVLRGLGRSLPHPGLGRGAWLTDRALAAIPTSLLRFFLACLPVFVLANIVVFQSWDWDNTKLLLYWYLGVALLVATIAVRLWAGIWRRLLAVVLVASMVATGTLVVVRLIPHPSSPLLGPFVMASAVDEQLASKLDARTATDAVFLIPGSGSSWDDPVALLTWASGGDGLDRLAVELRARLRPSSGGRRHRLPGLRRPEPRRLPDHSRHPAPLPGQLRRGRPVRAATGLRVVGCPGAPGHRVGRNHGHLRRDGGDPITSPVVDAHVHVIPESVAGRAALADAWFGACHERGRRVAGSASCWLTSTPMPSIAPWSSLGRLQTLASAPRRTISWPSCNAGFPTGWWAAG